MTRLSPELRQRVIDLVISRQFGETIEFSVDANKATKKKELLSVGLKYRCKNCGNFFKEKPWRQTEENDRCEVCQCGCKDFELTENIDCLKATVTPVDGVIILKTGNRKHCQCQSGMFGSNSKKPCLAVIVDIKDFEFGRIGYCKTGEFILVCLKDK